MNVWEKRQIIYRYFVGLGEKRLLARLPMTVLPGFFGFPLTLVGRFQAGENPESTK
jgi:hypothetical protein